MKTKTRRILFCTLAILVLVAVAAVMIVIGRGHTVYFDNKTTEYNGQTYSAPYRVNVYVKGEQVAKLSARERGMTTWIGQNFEMVLEVTEEKDAEPQVWTVGLPLPYNLDGIIINVPALLQGLPEDAWMSEFVPTVVEEDPDEGLPIEDDGLGMGDEF